MLYAYLINILIGCAILLLIALTVSVIMLICILNDARQVSKECKDKFLVLTSVVDIASVFLNGLGLFKKRVKKK